MKKFLKSKKGFSLIELVIVIAILGVLAAVAITMFPRISGQSRDSADATQANNIRTAIATYIAESGDLDLNNMNVLATGNTALTADTTVTALAQDGEGISTNANLLISSIQKIIFDNADADGATTKRFGPYLENRHPNGDNAAIVNDYRPQGNGMTGWNINVNTTSGNVTVTAVNTGNRLTLN